MASKLWWHSIDLKQNEWAVASKEQNNGRINRSDWNIPLGDSEEYLEKLSGKLNNSRRKGSAHKSFVEVLKEKNTVLERERLANITKGQKF